MLLWWRLFQSAQGDKSKASRNCYRVADFSESAMTFVEVWPRRRFFKPFAIVVPDDARISGSHRVIYLKDQESIGLLRLTCWTCGN